METDYALFSPDFQPQKFWSLPHENRLARVRVLGGSGEKIAAIIRYGLDSSITENAIPLLELWEVLADYLDGDQFSDVYSPASTDQIRDGMYAYSLAEDLDALWHLVPNSPSSIGALLVSKLPAGGGMFLQIPGEVLANLSDYLLEILLSRNDVELKEVRKAVYFDTSKNDRLVSAALFCHFTLSNEEFRAVEDFKKAGQLEKIGQLAQSGRGLTMAQYAALRTIAKELGKEHSWSDWISDNRNAASSGLVGSSQIANSILDLQIFEVARSLMDAEQLPQKLQIFANCRSETGVWATFLNLHQVYSAERNKNALRKALPSVSNDWNGEEDINAIEEEVHSATVFQ